MEQLLQIYVLYSALVVHTIEASLTVFLSPITLILLVQCIIFLFLIDCTTLLLFKFSVLLALITARRTSKVFSFILIKNDET